jgi:hypothetical protein
MVEEIAIQKPVLSKEARSSVPRSVLDDAERKAGELAGKSRENLRNLVDQMLATYVEARDRDIVVFFNSGGMGWNTTKDTPGWASILDGIISLLKAMGYRPLLLNYRRTNSDFRGNVGEFIEAARRYPRKAKDLARRVEFLIDNLPNLKIIIAGESTGTVISEKTMRILKDRQTVYSIQTGMPFWHKPVVRERTLSINSNGRVIDTFSEGQVRAMLWATVKSWFGIPSPKGTILSWLKAPGHDYSWQYPGISSAVIEFLESNFGKKV